MVTVNKGDVVLALMSGAGGYGDPLQRAPSAVLRDVRLGTVSVDAARNDYGVVITNGAVDEAASAAARAGVAQAALHKGNNGGNNSDGNRDRNGVHSGSGIGIDQGLNKGFSFGAERAAWEAVFDDTRTAALDARLANLPAHERQRRRHALFRALEPRLMVPATEQRYGFSELFKDPQAVQARLDELLAQAWD